MSTTSLKLEEVQHRVSSYSNKESEITDELYSFGEFLVRDSAERISQCDTKAFALAAYSGGIITVILSTSALVKDSKDHFSHSMIFFGILGLAISAGLAIRAVRPLPLDWFSDNDWLRDECFGSSDQLRRYRIVTMWKIIKSHQMASQSKLSWISRSQKAMVYSFVFLLAALLEVSARSATLQSLRVWIR